MSQPKEVVVVEENNDTQDKFVIFGDSQIAGNIGIELESTYGGYREGVSSTKATYWLEQIKVELSQKNLIQSQVT